MWAMSRTVPAAIEQRGRPPVVYYISDHWPSTADVHTHYWTLPANHAIMRIPKRLLGWLALRILSAEGKPVILRFDHAICVSAAVRDNLVNAGLAPFRKATVIHGGTDAARFPQRSPDKRDQLSDQHLSLLYAGRLVQDKGVHTAIEALGRLVNQEGLTEVTLTIAGSGRPDYERHLHAMVADQDLADRVSFRGAVPREKMPALLPQFDVLIFPSIYEEPLARMTQEAMLSGLVVVGTTTGGTKEILEHGVNGLTFAPEDAGGLARQIKRLAADPGLRRQLADAGRRTVLERFTLTRMMDEIEDYLLRIVSEPQSNGSAL
jgi:glycosyltransferase involved in cell wall biosynthesis